MKIDYEGSKYETCNKEKEQKAHDEIRTMAETLLLKYENDEEMFFFILSEMAHYGNIGAKQCIEKYSGGFENFKKYVELKKVK